MEKIARLVHHLAGKFLKKKNHRRSIEAKRDHEAFRRNDALLRMKNEEEEDDLDEVTPPVSPSRSRALAFLRASTPVKTNGIFVHEGSGSVEEEEEGDEVSQAEDCVEWNDSVHSVRVDSPEEFHVIGGEDSDSSLSMEEAGAEETKEEITRNVFSSLVETLDEFVDDDDYEEDSFDCINMLQSSFPVKKEEESFVYPTVLEQDDEGYFWDEPQGFSHPSLAPAVPSQFTVPSLCDYSEEDLGNVARSIMEEDGKKVKRGWKATANNVYAVSESPSHPSPRPDTPTTNGEISPSRRANLSDGSVESACTGATEVSTVPKVELTRPECAEDADNAWLRSLFEKSGMAHEIPDWMRVDPPTQKMRLADESLVMGRVGRRAGFATSTPEIAFASPAFSSISAIGRNLNLNDSNMTYSSPLLDGNISVGGKTFSLDVSVRARAALAKPARELYTFTYGIEEGEDE